MELRFIFLIVLFKTSGAGIKDVPFMSMPLCLSFQYPSICIVFGFHAMGEAYEDVCAFYDGGTSIERDGFYTVIFISFLVRTCNDIIGFVIVIQVYQVERHVQVVRRVASRMCVYVRRVRYDERDNNAIRARERVSVIATYCRLPKICGLANDVKRNMANCYFYAK